MGQEETLTFADYERDAMRTRKRAPGEEVSPDVDLAVMALGLAGEAGEVAERIKKALGHGHPIDAVELTNELGDVLWYLTALADWIDVPLSEVAQANIAKLRKRYPDGFRFDASRNRSDQ